MDQAAKVVKDPLGLPDQVAPISAGEQMAVTQATTGLGLPSVQKQAEL